MNRRIPLLWMAMLGLAFGDGEVRIDPGTAKSHIASRVEPEYPVIARQMRVSGKVTLDAYVDTDGSVFKVEPVMGNPLLTPSAVKAVKKWKFAPFAKDGKPVQAIAPIDLEFRF